MNDESITASSRVSAATNIINIGYKFAATDNLIERVETLEAKYLSQTKGAYDNTSATTPDEPETREEEMDY